MRQANQQDYEILKDLKSKWHDNVKIDYDIISEPCIFYCYHGLWDVVYKLSQDGTYLKDRWHYVLSAHNAIMNYIKNEDQRQMKYDEGNKYREKTNEKREDIAKNGFRDNI